MRGRLRVQTRVQSQRILEFKQKAWKGGENSDLPASEIQPDEVALLENAIAFPEYIEGRSGSQKFSDTAMPGSGSFWALHQHKASKKWVLHRGSAVHIADSAMAAWTTATEYAHGSDGGTEAGDASNQLADTFFFGASTSNTDAGVLYWNLTNSGSTRTLSFYKNSGKTQLVASGSRVGNGAINLNQQNASGLFGVSTVTYTGDDTDSANTYTLVVGSTLNGASLLANAQSTIRDFFDGVIIASDTSQIPNRVTLINLTDSKGYPLNPYGPVVAITGSGSQAAATAYGYRYLYTFSRITDTSGVGDPSKTRIDGVLVHETGAVRPSPTGNDTPIDYGEFWVANPINSTNTHTLTFNIYSNIINAGLSMSGHFTHFSLYRTLDIGAAGVDPVTGSGNNPELYTWVGDYPMGGGDIVVTKSDDLLRAAFSKGFGLKSRFFEPIENGDILEITPNFIHVGRRGQPKINYCQVAGDYKVHAGYHRRDQQFLKADDGVQAVVVSEDLMTILCGDKTYISSQNSYFNAGDIESVFVLNHLVVAAETIGVRDFGSITKIDSGAFIARCSDHSIRVWNGSSWGPDLSSRRVNRLSQKMLVGSVGGFSAGAFYLWYRTDSGQSYNNLCLRYGFGREGGFGWSRVTGTDWVYPPTNMGAGLFRDSNSIQRLIVLDSPGSAFYWIETFDGYTGSGLTKVYTDKVTVAGVAGTVIAGKVRQREHVGEKESHTLYHEETHAYVRPTGTSLPAAFAINLLGYADGATTATETLTGVNQKGDWQFWTSVTGKRIQMELNFATSGWRLIGVDTRVQSQDAASITLGPTTTAEGSSQAALAGTGLKHWLTRPKNLLNRATGSSYTLTGTAPTNVTGPDGKAYALSFVTGASYLLADTTSYSDFTIILWIKTVTVGNRLLIITGTNSFYLTLTNNTTLSVNGDGNVTLDTVASGWHQIAAVRSGSTVTIYQNGVSKGTVTVATARGGTSVTLNPDAVAMILSELRILNTALAAADILYNYTDINSNSGTKILPMV